MTGGLADGGAAKPRWVPEAGRDFSSLMLCCLVILLAYILSLPSTGQRPNRGKEPQLVLAAPSEELSALA